MLLRPNAWLVWIALVVSQSALAQVAAVGQVEAQTATGPVKLRQASPKAIPVAPTPAIARAVRDADEFERFVSSMAGFTASGQPVAVRRFGADFLQAMAEDQLDSLPSPLVPNDYLVKPGDSVNLTLWGSVDAELDLLVDRSGRISIPRVGAVLVAGTRFVDLPELLRRRVAQTFRNFELNVSMGALSGVRVLVTGFVQRPGAYNLTSLSTVSQALLRAGGPTAAGSFREIVLRRQGQAAVPFDLYDLLVKGERQGDRVLAPDDVVHVGPVGVQVGLIGSVNAPSIFEVKPGETVGDVLQFSGGFSAVADVTRLTLERLGERDKLRVVELTMPRNQSKTLEQGDVLRAVSFVAAAGSQLRRNNRVLIEGEVARPGTYILSAGSSVQDALQAAGGFTPAAFVFGSELYRESVRIGQQENYERALRDVEVEVARAGATQRTNSGDESAVQAARTASTTRLIERLRAIRPTGRLVLELTPASKDLPSLILEDSDRLFIPSRASSVGVFGSVFSVGSYLYSDQRTLADYLRLAGGPTRGADRSSAFVIRANGSVISDSQTSGWFTSGTLDGTTALPGDTLFVPEELNKTTFIQNVKDWTQILFQFGLGVAAFKSLGN